MPLNTVPHVLNSSLNVCIFWRKPFHYNNNLTVNFKLLESNSFLLLLEQENIFDEWKYQEISVVVEITIHSHMNTLKGESSLELFLI